MIGRSPYLKGILSAFLFGILWVTASCGDPQDPASGPPVQSGLQGAELTNTETVGLAGTATSAPTRPVTLSWDPSSSQDVRGYKVYLIAVSTAVEQIIDVGLATELAVPLKIGESYGFTVTAYNASLESQSVPYLLFQVF
jgi:hypothetical protein